MVGKRTDPSFYLDKSAFGGSLPRVTEILPTYFCTPDDDFDLFSDDSEAHLAIASPIGVNEGDIAVHEFGQKVRGVIASEFITNSALFDFFLFPVS